MAKIRTIKPQFFTSTQIMELSIPARYLFIGMWVHADDNGVIPLSLKSLKARVFPCDPMTEKDMKGFVDELMNQKLIIVYPNSDINYVKILGWKHQGFIKNHYAQYPLPEEIESIKCTNSEQNKVKKMDKKKTKRSPEGVLEESLRSPEALGKESSHTPEGVLEMEMEMEMEIITTTTAGVRTQNSFLPVQIPVDPQPIIKSTRTCHEEELYNYSYSPTAYSYIVEPYTVNGHLNVSNRASIDKNQESFKNEENRKELYKEDKLSTDNDNDSQELKIYEEEDFEKFFKEKKFPDSQVYHSKTKKMFSIWRKENLKTEEIWDSILEINKRLKKEVHLSYYLHPVIELITSRSSNGEDKDKLLKGEGNNGNKKSNGNRRAKSTRELFYDNLELSSVK